MQKTEAMIELAIERASKCARAEVAFGAVSKERNPWKGSAKELAELEKEREASQIQREGEELLKRIAAYRDTYLTIREHEASEAVAQRELDEAEASTVVARYFTARERTRSASKGHHFETYSNYLFSTSTAHPVSRPQGGSPGEDWPEEWRFETESDRAALRRWKKAQVELASAGQRKQNARAKRDHMLREFPELAAVDLAEVPV